MNISNATLPYQFLWNDNIGSQGNNTLSAGTNRVKLVDANGCQKEEEFTIDQPSEVEVNVDFKDTVICLSTGVDLSASASNGNGAPYTYNWYYRSLSNPISQTTNVSDSGKYIVMAQDVNSCNSNYDTLEIRLLDPLDVEAFNDTVTCVGDEINIRAVANGGNGDYHYSWSMTSEDTNYVSYTPTGTAFGDSLYFVVEVSDFCSPSAKDSILLTYEETPDLDFVAVDSIECTPLQTSIINHSQFGHSFRWSVNGEVVSNEFEFSVDYGVGEYDVTLESWSTKGCYASLTKKSYLKSKPFPESQFSWNPKEPDLTNYMVQFFNQSTGPADVATWTLSQGDSLDIFSSSKSSPFYDFSGDTGNYVMELKVTSEFGCTDSVSHLIRVSPGLSVYAPKAFSPNGDGVNDVFEINGFGFYDADGFELTIYNRWGEQVFVSTDRAEGWAGIYNYEMSKDGTFAWQLKVKDWEGESHTFQGSVSIMR